ncbi:MAG: YlmC/YmxH family sporulation protein [Oscillospiraceae bacterium]|nr:YlmC/YmxH family sporulation protein [Oscillospiraceae bacterium]
MLAAFGEICEKEIINTLDGSSFGFAGDILFDTETRKITAIIVKGKPKFFGVFGREEDLSIMWDKIETIGKDIILVKTEEYGRIHNKKENIFQKIFNIFFY